MSLAVVPCTDRAQWDEAVNALGGHPQQLWGWGQTKAEHGWSVDRVLLLDAAEGTTGADAAKGTIGADAAEGTTGADAPRGTSGADQDPTVACAQLLIRRLPAPFKALVYIPRGPSCAAEHAEAVLDALCRYARARHRGVALSIEPDWDAGSPFESAAVATGFQSSSNTILIPRTLILDLALTEDQLLGAMTKKHRQYIRKSARDGIDVREVRRDELGRCLEVYRQTAERAGFGIHEDRYYLDIFENLGEASPVYAAFRDGGMLAFLWLSASRTTAFELYGGMTAEGEKLRANYALKWHAIQAMKAGGVARYDFNGLLNDGVSRFKMGWAGHEDMLMGTWDRPVSPWYPLYARAMPLARSALRGVRKAVGALHRR
jgi:peptidoglycan pentaglycine glycine transferase (the first glycine)